MPFKLKVRFKFDDDVSHKLSFEEFVARTPYDPPIEGLCDILPFITDNRQPRMCMGARGIGKSYTYAEIIAWLIYRDPLFTCIITGKSKSGIEKDASLITACLEANGVKVRGSYMSGLRVKGNNHGEPNVLTLPVGSKGFRSHHPKLIWGDDMVGPLDAWSEAERRSVEECYDELVQLTTNIVLAGQPVSNLDLYYGKLRGRVKELALPWGSVPSRDHDLSVLRQTTSERKIQASYFLNVMADAAMSFLTVQECEYFTPSNDMDIDPSAGKGDYTAIVLGGVDPLSRCHISVGFMFEEAYWDLVPDMKIILTLFPCNRVFVETNGVGAKAEIDLRDAGIPATGYCTKASTKHQRIIQMADKTDYIRLFKLTPEFLESKGYAQSVVGRLVEANEIYRSNVRKYAYKAKHDDGIDALAALMLNTGHLPMDEDKWRVDE